MRRWRQSSRASMCLQVPRVFTAKSAHEQKFSNRLGPRIAKLSRANRGEVAERLNAAVC
jgi:hypothetical protein